MYITGGIMKRIITATILGIFLSVLLYSQMIVVKEPANNVLLTIGKQTNIHWQARGLKKPVQISLWRNGIFLGFIAKLSDPDAIDYRWQVGKHSRGTATAGNGYQIRIREMGGSPVIGFSPGQFRLQDPVAYGSEVVINPGVFAKPDLNLSLVGCTVRKGGGNVINFKIKYRSNLTVSVHFRVKNTGKKRTPFVYWDLNYWIQPSVNKPSITGIIPPLNPGQVWDKWLTGQVTKNYSLRVFIDSTRKIRESDEKDNLSEVFDLTHL